VDILNPSNVVVVNDAALTRESLGQFYYDFTAEPDAPLGAWIARFTGVISGAAVSGDEEFTVIAAGTVGDGTPWLVQLGQLRTLLGYDPTNTRDDARYSALIPLASLAIRSYTERDFGAPLVTEERTFEYDGSGYLDIDDATEITGVKFVVPRSTDVEVPEDAWVPMPRRRDDSPVFYYLWVASGQGFSPEMGFLYNLDRWVAEHGPGVTGLAKVTGTWGWPDVPGDVQLATIWTAQSWKDKPTQNLTAEAIEGYSRAWGSRSGGAGITLAIPNEARDLLENYRKQRV
jgi:hypothetical protein